MCSWVQVTGHIVELGRSSLVGGYRIPKSSNTLCQAPITPLAADIQTFCLHLLHSIILICSTAGVSELGGSKPKGFMEIK